MLRILGGMRYAERELRFRSRRAAELLGLLALAREGTMPRSEAAETLWPEIDPDRAGHNLRQTLVYLREGLPDGAIQADRERLTLCPPCDAREFARLAAGPSEGWADGLALDGGELLPGIAGEWVERARAVHGAARLGLLLHLAELRRADDPDESLRLARLAIEADPLLEGARRAVLEALLLRGERARAVEEFAAYDRLLRAELGLAASPALRALAFGEDADADEAEPPLTPAARLAVAIGLAARDEATERFTIGRNRLAAALEDAPEASPDARATALAWIARFEFNAGLWPASIEHAREAVALACSGSTRAYARVQLARALAWNGAREEACVLAENALRTAKARHDAELAVEALLTLGACAWHAHDLVRSARLYARAGRGAIRARSPVQETRAFLSLASIRQRLEGPEAAIVTAERTIGAATRSGMPSLTSHARGDLARYREAAGDLDGARRGYESALLATEGGRNPLARSQALTYLGDLETRMGRAESGSVLHAEAVALRRVAGDRIALATSLRGLGKARLALGDARGAREAFVEAIRIFEAAGAMEASPTARLPLARALLMLSLNSEARLQARRAIEEWAELSPESREVQVADGSLGEEAIASLRAEFAVQGLSL